jgi:hypothetical protein
MIRKRDGMLRISVIDSRTERRLVLEGKLIGPWVAELRKAWKEASGDIAGRALVVDVKNVCIISEEGENALLELVSEGAMFRCRGVVTKHLIQQLRRRSKRNSNEAIQAAHCRVRDDQGRK